MENVLKCVGWETSAAPMIIKITSAINKLLFTQISELSKLQEIVSLKSSYSGESPAAAAVALVLDGSHTADVSPVPVGGDILKLILLLLHSLVVSGRAVLRVFHDVEQLRKL